MRTPLAIAAAKLAGSLSRRRGGGATSLPGLVGLRVQPQVVRRLSRELAGVIVVTGTNGKTTTARFIGQVLETAGHPYIHNQAGSNLLRGIASSLILRRPPQSERGRTWGLFEVDEATMPAACRELQPDVVVVTNLFRDQLDRYGELKQTAEYLRQGIQTLPKKSALVLNADDPLVATLGNGQRHPVSYFGIDDTSVSKPGLPHAADSLTSPLGGELLAYEAVFVGHLGHYRSPSGAKEEFRRPQPQVAAGKIRLKGLEGSSVDISTTGKHTKLTIPLPGLYNIYNALAAVACGTILKVPLIKIGPAISRTAAAFGRVEHVKVGRQELFIGLIKNPTGTNELIHTLALDKQPKDLLIAINDNFADGRDVSWLWDADFEELLSVARRITVSGTRADDMAVRLKYAGYDPAELAIQSDVSKALTAGLKHTPKGKRLYVLPTYTAMLELRRILSKRGYLKHYLD